MADIQTLLNQTNRKHRAGEDERCLENAAVVVTRFKHYETARVQKVETYESFKELYDECFTEPIISADKSATPCSIYGILKKRQRKREYVDTLTCVSIDQDNAHNDEHKYPDHQAGTGPVDDVMTFAKTKRLVEESGYEGIVHTTPSNKHKRFKLKKERKKDPDRYSPVFELSRNRTLIHSEPFAKELLPAAYSLIRRKVFKEHDGVDEGSNQPERVYIDYSCPADRVHLAESDYIPGRRLTLVEIQAEHERLERAKPKQKIQKASKNRFDKSEAIARKLTEKHEWGINREKDEDDGTTTFELEQCPFCDHDEDHYPAFIQIYPSGALHFDCLRTSCPGHGVGWNGLWKRFEPNLYSRSNGDPEGKGEDGFDYKEYMEEIRDRIPQNLSPEKIFDAYGELIPELACFKQGDFDYLIEHKELVQNCPTCGEDDTTQLLDIVKRLRDLKYKMTLEGMREISIEKEGQKFRNESEPPICDHNAYIVEEIEIDTGNKLEYRYGLVAREPSGAMLPKRIVESKSLSRIEAIMDIWGANVCLLNDAKPSAFREAVQTIGKAMSKTGRIPTKKVFAYTGITTVGKDKVFLSPGACITVNGSRSDIEVDLQVPKLNEGYRLVQPPQGSELRKVVREQLKVRTVAPLAFTVPQLGSVSVAPLGEFHRPEHSDYVYGETGSGKSTFHGVLMSFCGIKFHGGNLPASFVSTLSYLDIIRYRLNGLYFVCDEATLPVGKKRDDFVAELDRFFRSHANNDARGRANPKGGLNEDSYPSRCMLACNGEGLEGIPSLRARIWPIEFYSGCLDWNQISEMQQKGREGVYVAGYSGYIQWILRNYDALKEAIPVTLEQYREDHKELAIVHKRLPCNLAEKLIGLRAYYTFALECGAVTREQRDELFAEDREVLVQAAKESAGVQQSSNPVDIFLRSIFEGLSSGKFHLENSDPEKLQPSDPLRWGWRKDGGWKGQGVRLGCIHEPKNEIHLLPDTTYTEAQRTSGNRIHFGADELYSLLRDRGLSKCEPGRNVIKRSTLPGVNRPLCLNLTAVENYFEVERDELVEQKRKNAAQEDKVFGKHQRKNRRK